MKKLLIASSLFFAMLVCTTNSAQAQQRATVGSLLSGLINVNIGAVQVDVELDNVLNDFTLVNVENSLNNNQIDILRNAIQNNPILSYNQDVLNNLLQGADIITDNTVVVGVLGGVIYVLEL